MVFRQPLRTVALVILGAMSGCLECYSTGGDEGPGNVETTGPGADGEPCDIESESRGIWCDAVCIDRQSIDNCDACGNRCAVQQVVGGGEETETLGGCLGANPYACGPLLEGCFQVGTSAAIGMEETACDDGSFVGDYTTCREYCTAVGKTLVESYNGIGCGPDSTFSARLYDSFDDCTPVMDDSCEPAPNATGIGTDHTDPKMCEVVPRGASPVVGYDDCLATPGFPARWARCCCRPLGG